MDFPGLHAAQSHEKEPTPDSDHWFSLCGVPTPLSLGLLSEASLGLRRHRPRPDQHPSTPPALGVPPPPWEKPRPAQSPRGTIRKDDTDAEEEEMLERGEVLRKLCLGSFEDQQPKTGATSSASHCPWKELELSCEKLDSADIRITSLDLSCLTQEHNSWNADPAACAQSLRYNFEVDSSPASSRTESLFHGTPVSATSSASSSQAATSAPTTYPGPSPTTRPGSATHRTATSPYATPPYATSPHATSPYATSPYASSPYAMSPHATSPCASSPHATSPCASSPHARSPYAMSPHATSPYASSPHVRSPHARSPHARSPHVRSPSATSAGFTRPPTSPSWNQAVSMRTEGFRSIHPMYAHGKRADKLTGQPLHKGERVVLGGSQEPTWLTDLRTQVVSNSLPPPSPSINSESSQQPQYPDMMIPFGSMDVGSGHSDQCTCAWCPHPAHSDTHPNTWGSFHSPMPTESSGIVNMGHQRMSMVHDGRGQWAAQARGTFKGSSSVRLSAAPAGASGSSTVVVVAPGARTKGCGEGRPRGVQGLIRSVKNRCGDLFASHKDVK